LLLDGTGARMTLFVLTGAAVVNVVTALPLVRFARPAQ